MRRILKCLLIIIVCTLSLAITTLATSSQSLVSDVPGCVSELLSTEMSLEQAQEELEALQNERHNAHDQLGEAEVLYCQGIIYYIQGQYPNNQQPFLEARQRFERALVIFRDFDDLAHAARSQHQLGRTYFVVRDFTHSLPHFQQALQTAEYTSDSEVLGDIHFDIGLYYVLQNTPNDLREAAQNFSAAYDAYLTLLDIPHQAESLFNLAATEFSLWEFETSSEHYLEAARLFHELHDAFHEGQALNGAAQILHHVGELDEAVEAYQSVLALFEEANDIAGQGRVISALGNIYSQFGYSNAESTLRNALMLNRSAGDSVGVSITLSYLGLEQLARGNTSDALANINTAVEIADNLGDIEAGALAYHSRGQVYAELARQGLEPLRSALNDFGEASRRYRYILGDEYNLRRVFINEANARLTSNSRDTDSYEPLFFEALNIARSIGDTRGEMEALMALGGLYSERMQYDEAANYFEEATQVATELDDPVSVGIANQLLGELDYESIHYSEARAHLEIARDNYEDAGEIGKAAVVNSLLGNVYRAIGDYREAFRLYQASINALDDHDSEHTNTTLVQRSLSTTAMSMGLLYLELGLHNRALPQLENAIAQLTIADNEFAVAEAQVAVGDLHVAHRNYDDALDSYRRAQRVAESAGNIRAHAHAQSGQAFVLAITSRGTELEIQQLFEGALEELRQSGDIAGSRQVYLNMGDAALFQQHIRSAVNYFAEARRAASTVGDLRNASYATLRLAHAYSRDTSDVLGISAIRTLETALEEFRNLRDFEGEGFAYLALGDLALRRSQYAIAIENYTRMRTAFSNANSPIRESTALARLGYTYQLQLRYDLALSSFNDALNAARLEIDNSDALADVRLATIAEGYALYSRGDLYRILGQFDVAEVDLSRAVNLLQDESLLADDQLCRALIALGTLQLERRQFTNALETYEHARDIASRVNDIEGRALALFGVAKVDTADDVAGNVGEEVRAYSRVLGIFRNEAFNPRLALLVIESTAASYEKRGLYRDAEVWYRTARNEAHQVDDAVGEGHALLSLGRLRAHRNRFSEAVVDYEEAMRQFQRRDDWIGRGEALYGLAEIYLLQVDYLNALSSYQEALELFEREGDLIRQADALTRIGEAYQRQSQLALALNQHFVALDRLAQARASYSGQDIERLSANTEARILRNLGAVRLSMGQFVEAQSTFEAALDLASQAQDVLEVALIRQQLGRIDFLVNDYGAAIEIYQTALDEIADISVPQSQAELLFDIANATFHLASTFGDSDTTSTTQPTIDLDLALEARSYFLRALDLSRVLGDKLLEGRVQQGLGALFNRLQQDGEAQTRLAGALRLAEEINAPTLQGSILVDLGLLSEERGDLDAAISYYQRAVEFFEDVYADIRLEPGQIAFASQNIQPYHRLVELYAESNPELAFAYAERGRARTLLYQLGSEQIDFGITAGAELLSEWQQRRQLIRGIYEQIEANLAARRDAPNDVERHRLQEEIFDLRRSVVEIQNGLGDLEERIYIQSAVLAQVTRINPRELTEVQGDLDTETTLLSYYIVPSSSVNDGSVYAFTISRSDFGVKRLRISPESLNDLVRTNIRSERELQSIGPSFSDLYDSLIAPIKDHLVGSHVVVVPHGILNALPFSALVSSTTSTFFGDERVVSYSSSATLYSLLREDRSPNIGILSESAVVIGNPTFPDYFQPTEAPLGALPGAEREAIRVAELLRVSPRIGSDATESALWLEARGAHVIHIAAHGVFNPQNPLASYLALADDDENDGHLQAREIYSLAISENEPLIVLSACDTATGGGDQSDDLQSLSRAFLISGARAVVASLWKVDDEATQALMERFYENVLEGEMAPAEALQNAQMFVREQSGWSAPKYWAAFTLIGLPT